MPQAVTIRSLPKAFELVKAIERLEGRVRQFEAPFDPVWTAPAERSQRRSDHRGSSRRYGVGRSSSFCGSAATAWADHADHRDRLRSGPRSGDPIRDCAFGAVLPSGYQVLAWGNRF